MNLGRGKRQRRDNANATLLHPQNDKACACVLCCLQACDAKRMEGVVKPVGLAWLAGMAGAR